MSMKELTLADFPVRTYDKVRYADTDRQGHVNNAVFSNFLETGRVEILYNPDYPFITGKNSFVIASMKLEYLKEINWPGLVETGTAVLRAGNSSITFFQMLFQNGICVAKAETVIVNVDNLANKSSAIDQKAKDVLNQWIIQI